MTENDKAVLTAFFTGVLFAWEDDAEMHCHQGSEWVMECCTSHELAEEMVKRLEAYHAPTLDTQMERKDAA